MSRSELMQSTGRPGRWQLLMIGLVFVLPVAAALLWKPSGQINYGDLLQPARVIQDVGLQRMDGTSFAFSALRGKWTLIYVGNKLCDRVCEESLYKIQRVRLAQNKNTHRVQSVYLLRASAGGQRLQELIKRYPGVVTLFGVDAAFEQLVEQFEVGNQTPLDDVQRIYVVDPLGNLMMSYPPDADPTAMRKDLRRLLKVSQIG